MKYRRTDFYWWLIPAYILVCAWRASALVTALVLGAIVMLILSLFCGCSDCGTWRYHQDGTYGPWWWNSEAREDAPASLKQYYDEDLTRRLNQ